MGEVERGAGRAGIVGAQPVDQDHDVITVGAADIEAGALAERAGLVGGQAGGVDQDVLHRPVLALLDLGAIDDGDRIGQAFGLLLVARGGDHGFGQHDSGGFLRQRGAGREQERGGKQEGPVRASGSDGGQHLRIPPQATTLSASSPTEIRSFGAPRPREMVTLSPAGLLACGSSLLPWPSRELSQWRVSGRRSPLTVAGAAAD